MSASVRIALLGELDIRRGETLVVLRSRAQRCVLSVLALHAGRAVPTSALIDALWPDDPPATATASLTNHVHRLRAALGPDIITTRAPGYALAIDPAAIDLHQFAALQRGENTPTDLFTLEAQLALWRDVPFAEFADDEWARPTIVGLIEVHHTLRERRIRKLINAGLFERAIADAESLCASEPLREQPCALLMLALRRAHRTTEALRAYDSFRKRIVNQTGLEPSASLTSLEREIVADLGRAADRDGSIEWGGYAQWRRGSQVPAEVTSLLGRDLDVEEIVQYLAVRPLVTLTGLGGVGKTRVAIRVAHRLRSLFDDVVWVDLAAVRAANEVIGAIAAAMGVASTFGDPLDAISQRTRAGRLLIVLDNCEHVIVESAPLCRSHGGGRRRDADRGNEP